MSLVAKVDESDIAKIQPGQASTISLEAYPDKQYPGVVAKIADVATTNEAGATAFDVTIQVDQADTRLKIGMTGTADVTIATKKAAAVVPIEAIVDKKNKKYVFKVKDGKAHLTPVTLGLTTENSVEIIEGVVVGDKVVIKGVEKLKDGQGVKI
jgi:HlyD family secretion protein